MNPGRLVELEMAFLGPRVIIVEFTAGVAGCFALGVFSLAYAARVHAGVASWSVVIGLELVAIGINYIPLLAGALRRRKDDAGRAAAKAAIRDNPAEARSYGLRQAWILVPGAVVVFALAGRRR
ncbi:MAG: hypothetical protein ACHQ0J_15055 [Candidatus Dormibacterales bacterium]